jgi:DNA-directed RNA polymerase subunit M/transcription elongation factor TFIIS
MSHLDPVKGFIKTITKFHPYFGEELKAITIRLHNAEIFSEGYTAAVLGIERVEVRKLAQAPSKATPIIDIFCPNCGEKRNYFILAQKTDVREDRVCMKCEYEWIAYFDVIDPEV